MPTRRTSSGSTGLGCLFLFALPFAGVGVFMGFLTIWSVADWFSMRSWVPVDAELVSVDLEESRGSDSTTYEVTASYRYTYDGRQYIGLRVGLHTGSDSIGGYQRDTYRKLAARRGKTVVCFVDPDEPSRAVLDRNLRYERLGFYLLFVVLFGGAGFGLMAGGIHGSRKAKRERELKALHPDEPWLHNEEWQTGRIRSSNKAAFLATAIFAAVWNMISMPMVFFLRDEIFDPDNRLALVALLFPVVGVGLAVWAVRSFFRWQKFGESVFEMSTMPGVLGGPLEGTIRPSTAIHAGGGFDVTLSSIHKYRSGTGKNRRTREKVLWQKSYRAGLDPSHGGIPVSFYVPYECEPTDVDEPDNQKIWRVEVTADVVGVDYHAQFEVPVFRTEHSSPEPMEPGDLTPPPTRIEYPLEQKLKKSGARVEPTPEGRRYVFPMARNPGSALALSGFFAVWTGITAGLWYSDAPRFFPWVFGFFDALILWGVLDFWFHSSRIEVRPGRLRFASGLFGGRERELTGTDVEEIATKRGTQSGNTLYYQLQIRERGGRSHTAAKRLADLDTAERLAKEIESFLC